MFDGGEVTSRLRLWGFGVVSGVAQIQMKNCHDIANDSFMESPLPAKLDSIKFLGTQKVLGGRRCHCLGLFFSGVCGRIRFGSNFKVFIPTNEIALSKTSRDKLISINFFQCCRHIEERIFD